LPFVFGNAQLHIPESIDRISQTFRPRHAFGQHVQAILFLLNRSTSKYRLADRGFELLYDGVYNAADLNKSVQP
jgi:hypothetical protein